MQPAVLIARLIGPLFAVLGVGMLANQTLYAEMIPEAVRIPTLIYLSGLLALAAGLAMLNFHRAWTADWRVIITVLGWMIVIAGVIRIVLPRLTASLATTIYSGPVAIAIGGAVVLVLGGFLSFKGYRQ
jgi:uncharacterized membrane protein